ncbi:DUF3955 domain-containing protein [Romboutsia maritimum]|uniref:DUF3955 domain-containing protein n=1 Tax=Romboutsia maritimum TaxID=2020948 RepID=A0A371IRU7_9FIRM|nr:DUF3955 domain-containing protein [Romboutsia maritimum]RDY23199.1 DUF3955 domain-containing protein [Romboutsia maritimum]
MKKNILNLIPFIMGIGCLLAFNFIGSEVASDGTLVEPFFLIPFAYILFLIGIIGLLIRAVSLYCINKK